MPYHPATTIRPAAVILLQSEASVGSSAIVRKGSPSRLRKYDAAAVSSCPGTAGVDAGRTTATTVGGAAGAAITPSSLLIGAGATVSAVKLGTAATRGAPAGTAGTGFAVAAGRVAGA